MRQAQCFCFDKMIHFYFLLIYIIFIVSSLFKEKHSIATLNYNLYCFGRSVGLNFWILSGVTTLGQFSVVRVVTVGLWCSGTLGDLL